MQTFSRAAEQRQNSYAKISLTSNREAHYLKISFEEEFRALLKSHGIEFEEEYLWE
jgi:hypothetical protein